ncbi:hypothetical protein HN371_29470 [Candidatus Poribacteria bacterium]|nr:hypothetical protein [Candidatus Poribacteria bacterium]MBT5714599.1 hypothetical protein [Candidatus Poribacteria bacterium]MBT7808416.1 hypothetical protein [Candidatus Poribacteria bacterium]
MQFETTTRRLSRSRGAALSFMPVHLALMATCAIGLAQEPEIEWIDNYPAAIARAKATGKPLFLEFRCVP